MMWRGDTNSWRPVYLNIEEGSSVTFNSVGFHYWRVPRSVRYIKIQATSGDSVSNLEGCSVRINNELNIPGGQSGAQGQTIELPYSVIAYIGGQIVLEITDGTGDASVTVAW